MGANDENAAELFFSCFVCFLCVSIFLVLCFCHSVSFFNLHCKTFQVGKRKDSCKEASQATQKKSRETKKKK